jgi:DNA processing protein
VERALPRLPNADDWFSKRLRMLHLELARGRWAMAWDAPDFPQAWRELPDPPLVVFGEGEPFGEEDSRCHTAIVGTRKCTDEAQRVAFDLDKALARRSATVVSGLARGVDAAAHRGACYVGHRTVGILGGGVGNVQPRSGVPIATRMVELGGAVLSERVTGEPVQRWHFAARNRLVVGLSDAVVVVQSPAKGGALISAQLALDLGVTCWVYRPEKGLDTPPWAGNRKLLDEFSSMGWQSAEALAEQITKCHGIMNVFVAESGLPSAFRATWRHIMQTRGAQLDALAMRTGTDAESMRKQLHAMELGGWVRRMPGGWYVPLKI